ncbi:hypothetical protein IAT38_002351 [Cryptococcus sp. DSM 104549]
MSRRRQAGAIRGPSSALTSFLANLGVEPSTRLTTWGDRSAIDAAQTNGEQPDLGDVGEEDEVDPANAVTGRTTVAGPSQVGEGTPVVDDGYGGSGKRGREDDDSTAGDRNKKPRAASIDSDDLDAEDALPVSGPSRSSVPSASTSATPAARTAPGPLRPVGEFMECGECSKRFTVTAYTKEHPTNGSTYLCVNCCYALGIDPFAKAKKGPAKKKAPAKKDRAKVIHYETRKGAPALGDLCIQLIGKYIEDVEQLGPIGGINMDKVCRIISKNRRLTPETAPLFYSIDRDSLTMYDCTRLTPEAFIALGNLCPNLASLRLDLCGQLSTDALIAWGKSLKSLKRLELHAPFLVRKEGWLSFFKAAGKRLEGFLIFQSPRIDAETVGALVKYCPNLTELRLQEVGQLNADCVEELQKLKKLRLLDLSSPAHSLSDGVVIDLLSAVGGTLESLNLSDNPELTDEVLLAIVEHCPCLRRLILRNAVELSDTGVAAFFDALSSAGRPGLERIDLEKGHDLQGQALQALLRHSGDSVEELSLHGWRDVDKEALEGLTKCGKLKTLDVGWCRRVDNFWVKDVLEGCGSLEQLRVWGCNELSDGVPRKRGVRVIGIETHSI